MAKKIHFDFSGLFSAEMLTVGGGSDKIASVKNSHWGIQNHAVAQILVIGRMTVMFFRCISNRDHLKDKQATAQF